MSAISDFNLKIKDSAFQAQIKKAVDELERLGVFNYLREVSDKKTSFVANSRPDVNGIVMAMSGHIGYAEALDNIMDLVNYAGSVDNTFLAKSSKYGVTEKDVE